MQQDYMIGPPLPLDGLTDRQPAVDIEANAAYSPPPGRGRHSLPQTMHDRAAVHLFAAERGFAIYPRSARCGLIHTILYDEANDRVVKVIFQACWSISKEYLGRDLWMAFRIKDELYLMPHDEMVRAAAADGFSWSARGTCSRSRVSAALRTRCLPYRIKPEEPRGTGILATPSQKGDRGSIPH